MTRLRTVALLSVLLCPAAPSAVAQSPSDGVPIEAPAHVSFVDGTATLERDGRVDSSLLNMPLLAGDRIRTQSGRVEVLYGDGSVLHVDAGSTIDFQSDELLRLIAGRVRLAIPGATRAVSYRIDAPWASAEIRQTGEYRVGIVRSENAEEVELDVLRGAADLVNELGRTPLRAGERAFARASAAPSIAYVYNSAQWDSFDQWSETRRDERMGTSAQYLPEDVRPYSASFDQYGSWDYQPSYGYVWYPRVAVGWRPYYNGRWATLRPYGWTWIGYDPWAWPTHHYGRWGFSAGAWFWIPGRNWGAAWVSWAYAPGYVSWCPLGWNNRPAVPIHYAGRGYDPWRAWTAVPERHFHSGHVNVRNVGRVDLDPHTRGTFAAGTQGPAYSGVAVARSAAPIRAAGTARRSSTSPLYTNMGPRDSRVGNAPSRTIVGAAPAPGDTRPRATPYGSSAASTAVPRTAAPAAVTPPVPRADYGRIQAAPSRSREYSSGTDIGRPMTRETVIPRGTDMGVGGNTSSPTAHENDHPIYAPPSDRRPADRRDSIGYPAGRAMPRSDPQGYRPDPQASRPSSPRDPRPADAAPSRPAAPAPRANAPEPRGGDRGPGGNAPSAPSAAPRGGYVRPNGVAPSGQAVPRGGRGGGRG